VQHDGKKVKQKQPAANTWTFHGGQCTGDTCTGTITSTSGRKFKYTWADEVLTVVVPPTRTNHATCYDDLTHQPVPKSEASFNEVQRDTLSPFHGTDTRKTSNFSESASYKFFGNCSESPTAEESATAIWTLTYLHP